MSDPNSQLKRVQEIQNEVRNSISYKVESAKLGFSEQICERLETLGLTRTELAERTGVSVPYITKILRGSTNFTLDSMVRIAAALDCDFDPLLRPKERNGSTAKSGTEKPRKLHRPVQAHPSGTKRLQSRRSKRTSATTATVNEPPAPFGKKTKD